MQDARYQLELSAPLKSGRDKSGIDDWLKDIELSSALIGGLLHTLHPELYRAGRQAWHTLSSHPSLVKESSELLNILPAYRSPFTAYSVISNRKTPVHRDNYSRPPWFDLLATVGTYLRGKLCLPGLGITLEYNPGAIVAICGQLIKHAVPEVEGDRVCVAHFMREKVQTRLEVPPATWAKMAMYIHALDR